MASYEFFSILIDFLNRTIDMTAIERAMLMTLTTKIVA